MATEFYKKCLSKARIYFSLLLIVFTFPIATAQEAPKFSVKIKFSCQQGGLENSLITIMKNGSAYRIIDPNKGKYFIDLDLGSEFKLIFTKPGHISKTVVIDTHVPNGREKEDFAKFDAIVSLAMQPEDQIITYSQPVGRIEYSENKQDFDFNKDYTATAQAQQKKDEEHPKPKPKPPTPNPRPEVKPPPVQTIAPSNPVPIVIKQPEYKPEPVKRKPPVPVPEIIYTPVVKNKEEKIIQKDRLKITIIVVTINGLPFEYKKEEYTWGGLYFYKDGANITEGMFARDTE